MAHFQETFTQKVIQRAAEWQSEIEKSMPGDEKKFQAMMGRLVSRKEDKYLLISLLDRAFRSHTPHKAAHAVRYAFQKYGMAAFFSSAEKMLVRLFLIAGYKFPSIAVPQIIARVRARSQNMIIPGEAPVLGNHLANNRRAGIRSNVNFLGEAILGEEEAARRLNEYIEALESPDINYVSIKISTLYSQLHPLAFEHNLEILEHRLSMLLKQAIRYAEAGPGGTPVPKFVNLDMEEYRDLELTVALFKRVLGKPEFFNCSAGIVLQAYLPDSFPVMKDLSEWARRRVAEGGAPLKVRIVKGANMEMERLESALKGFPLATYRHKADTDANFKRLIDFAMEPERIRALHLGIASHNIFDQAYAYEVAVKHNVLEFVSIEMLEGMAMQAARVLKKYNDNVLLYAPVVRKEDFVNTVAYLVRRLDENTSPENFLSKSFNLKPGTKEWDFLEQQFTESCERKVRLDTAPFRTQNRLADVPEYKFFTGADRFINEPDTDWALPANRRWAENIYARWSRDSREVPEKIPVFINGVQHYDELQVRDVYDKSQPEVLIAKAASAGEAEAVAALECARRDEDEWGLMSTGHRGKILAAAATEMAKQRAQLIGVAMAEVGKVILETDTEVSEAIDFARFYSHSLLRLEEEASATCRPKGVTVVISPWNFPIAIPAGGVAAALAAGNRVVLKPSSNAVYCAWELCKCFWAAGVPASALQFVPCAGHTLSRALHTSKADFIIFTGSTDVALQLYNEHPDIELFAETGGKNTTIVTSSADRLQAVKNIVHSAFGNSGQKCSATSLLILEEEVYNDENFKNSLRDACDSLSAGSAHKASTKVGPVISPPSGVLKRVLDALEPGEEWLSPPQIDPDNPSIMSPVIKWGVTRAGTLFQNELFAPVLGVVKVKDLQEAVELANSTGYGLTAGIETLNDDEAEYWKNNIEAGNLYINRSTTGAIVLRQPFGGYKKSSVGKGLKAGGYNYVTQFVKFSDGQLPAYPPAGELENELSPLLSKPGVEPKQLTASIRSYAYWFENLFGKETDYFSIPGESNHCRYLPYQQIVLRITADARLQDAAMAISACKAAKVNFYISLAEEREGAAVEMMKNLHVNITVKTESAEALTRLLSYNTRIRYITAGEVEKEVLGQARRSGIYIAADPMHQNGRIELLNYFREQSVSDSYHRYGNLMGRER